MATIQELLDQEAKLANAGHTKSDFRVIIHEEIRARRGNIAPACFGEDDCSTMMLVRCPWRMDCGV
jgi:hypothetical protein